MPGPNYEEPQSVSYKQDLFDSHRQIQIETIEMPHYEWGTIVPTMVSPNQREGFIEFWQSQRGNTENSIEIYSDLESSQYYNVCNASIYNQGPIPHSLYIG